MFDFPVFNADGTFSKTDVDTAAGASVSSTITQYYNAQWQLLGQAITYTDGSTTNRTFNADGSYTETDTKLVTGGTMTTMSSYNPSDQLVTQFLTNADGSTNDSTYTYTYNGDGSYSDTVVATPAGGEATTTVTSYNSQGQVVNTNDFAPSANGSYTDSWAKSDGSSGSYWWNAPTAEYLNTWNNSDGTSFTDEYQYGTGGSPTTPGSSYTETYNASDGSTGTRHYDATSNTTTVTWDSSQGAVVTSANTGDAGFIGLVNDGELTNTQNDLTYFNPATSPAFANVLAMH